MDSTFIDSNLYMYFVLPLLIFLARVVDVTIGTLRIILVSKGNKVLAPILGFFEILIWVVAIGQIMNNLNNYINYIAYAGGFAMGSYIGMLLEEYLAMGSLVVRVISPMNGENLVKAFKEKGYGATRVEGEGSMGRVQLVYSIVKRDDMPEVTKIIQGFNPKAFYSVEDVRKVSAGIFPTKSPIHKLNPFKRWRKGK